MAAEVSGCQGRALWGDSSPIPWLLGFVVNMVAKTLKCKTCAIVDCFIIEIGVLN